MNAYIESVIETVKKKHGNEPEFVQTVEEVLTSLDPVISAHPEYEAVDLLGRLVEPERMFTFRVVWTDDAGKHESGGCIRFTGRCGCLHISFRKIRTERLCYRPKHFG